MKIKVLVCLMVAFLLLSGTLLAQESSEMVYLKCKVKDAIIVEQFLTATVSPFLNGIERSRSFEWFRIPQVSLVSFDQLIQRANGPIFVGLDHDNFLCDFLYAGICFTGDIIYLTVYTDGGYPMLFIYRDKGALKHALQGVGYKWFAQKEYHWDGEYVRF